MTAIRTVRATITFQIFPYLNNGQMSKKIEDDARKIAEGFQVRDVKPEYGTVTFVFKNLTDVQRHRLTSGDDLIMYARAISRALGCEVVRLPARYKYEAHDKKTEVHAMFNAELKIHMNKVVM